MLRLARGTRRPTCFSAPVGRWVSEGQPDEHFAVDRYGEPLAWDAFLAAHYQRPVVRRHRPLQDDMKPLLDSGFALRELHEPAATPDQVARAPRLERLARIPYFLFMRWEKREPARRNA